PSEARLFAQSVLSKARYIFLGLDEAHTVFGLKAAPEDVLNALAPRAPQATIVVMQGEDGSTVLDNGRVWRPTVRHAVQMVDPIGAGDAFAAGYLWARLAERSPQEAIDIATTVATLKCSTWGDIALITKRDIEDALIRGPDVRR